MSGLTEPQHKAKIEEILTCLQALGLNRTLIVKVIDDKDMTCEPLSDDFHEFPPSSGPRTFKWVASLTSNSSAAGGCCLDVYEMTSEGPLTGRPYVRWAYEVIQTGYIAATREQPEEADSASLILTPSFPAALGSLVGQTTQLLVESFLFEVSDGH